VFFIASLGVTPECFIFRNGVSGTFQRQSFHVKSHVQQIKSLDIFDKNILKPAVDKRAASLIFETYVYNVSLG